MRVQLAYEALVDAGIDLITAVPDSALAPLCEYWASRAEIAYVQACDEATAVGLAAGARLAGARSLVVMENSGLRRACETLARLVLSHRLHTVMLLSRRGTLGEPNWWALPHEETMHPHLRMLSVVTAEVTSLKELPALLDRAYATLGTGQPSTALLAAPAFPSVLRGVA